MSANHGRDAVAPCLGAGDPAASVVVPSIECLSAIRTASPSVDVSPPVVVAPVSPNTIIRVDVQPASTRSRAAASRASTVKPDARRTSIILAAYQQRLRWGSHSAASLSRFPPKAPVTSGRTSPLFDEALRLERTAWLLARGGMWSTSSPSVVGSPTIVASVFRAPATGRARSRRAPSHRG